MGSYPQSDQHTLTPTPKLPPSPLQIPSAPRKGSRWLWKAVYCHSQRPFLGFSWRPLGRNSDFGLWKWSGVVLGSLPREQRDTPPLPPHPHPLPHTRWNGGICAELPPVMKERHVGRGSLFHRTAWNFTSEVKQTAPTLPHPRVPLLGHQCMWRSKVVKLGLIKGRNVYSRSCYSLSLSYSNLISDLQFCYFSLN